MLDFDKYECYNLLMLQLAPVSPTVCTLPRQFSPVIVLVVEIWSNAVVNSKVA